MRKITLLTLISAMTVQIDVRLQPLQLHQVESGCFTIYENQNYTGHQYYLGRADYPDYHQWMGVSDSVSSCHIIPMVSS